MTETWAIDANTLRSIRQQETNLTKGDEVYVASIKFRTTPGVVGTTSTAFHGGLVDITNVHQGETHTIPNTMGRVTFANVDTFTVEDFLAGRSPEVVGTATIVMESDLSGDNRVDKLFTEAATDARPIIAEVAEGLTLAEIIGDEQALAEALAQLARDLEAALKPTFLEKLGLFLTSFGDPDDPVGQRFNVFAAVDAVLAGAVDAAFEDLDPALGVGGALRPRTYTQRVSGRGATYELAFAVSPS